MLNTLPTLIITLIWGGASALAALPLILGPDEMIYRLIAVAALPLLFILCFSTLAGLLSRAAKRGMIAGKFPREPLHPIYLMRRIFNGCWTQLYYFKPVYSAVLAVPWLKTMIFRLFGYKGSMSFIVYPDTWIRDLPLLNFGSGVYIANRSTLGSNICLSDGSILVQGISLEENALVGHLAVMGPGCSMGKSSELGVGATLGMRVKIGDLSKINPGGGVNHGAKLGKNVKVGTRAHVGLKVVIADNIEIPQGALIPDGVTISTQAEMNAYFSAETKVMNETITNVVDILKSSMNVS